MGDGGIRVLHAVHEREFIAWATLGTQITPAVLGLASAAGYDTLTVLPRPRVELLWDVREDGVLAGHAEPERLTDGEAVRIATGAVRKCANGCRVSVGEKCAEAVPLRAAPHETRARVEERDGAARESKNVGGD